MMKLNRQEAFSYAGDMIPLYVFKEKKEEILERLNMSQPRDDIPAFWTSSDESVVCLRRFDEDPDYGFRCGVLAVLLKAGEATITAQVGSDTVTCRVTVRERRTWKRDEANGFYFGDFHSHTTQNHNNDTFKLRGPEEQACHSTKTVSEEGFYDAFTVTDHAVLIKEKEFFRLFVQEELAGYNNLITFMGSESAVTEVETDRFGVPRLHSGEVGTFNASGYANAPDWKTYFDKTSLNPWTMGCFNHPQILGYSVPGLWNFSLERKTTPQMRNRFHMIELGNGADREANLINERIYSIALDMGYRISPAMNSDSHGPGWGQTVLPGRTVLYAAEKSKEAFLEALLEARFYATESGDVKLVYSVNGQTAPCVLEVSSAGSARYEFEVNLDSFGANIPLKDLEVISDGGQVVFHKDIQKPVERFTLESDTSRYYFLRIWDVNGKRTWSCPVWTGRPFDSVGTGVEARLAGRPEIPGEQIAVQGPNEASLVCLTDPRETWSAEAPEAELVFDFGKPECLAGFSYYPHLLLSRSEGITVMDNNARFVDSCDLWVSQDGITFEEQGHVYFRSFSGEQYVEKRLEGRYVKMKIRSVGSVSRQPKYERAPVQIGKISFFR